MKELNEIFEKQLLEQSRRVAFMVERYIEIINPEYDPKSPKTEILPAWRKDIEEQCKSMLELLESYEKQYGLPEGSFLIN